MKLAIIIPVYNAEDTIKRAILSVDSKSDYEIICVNDGSTDNTKRVLTELQKEHKNIKVINQDNQGAARSRNVGLEAMSDDVEGFLFLDADDEFLPSRIDLMVEAFQKNEETDVVIGQMGRGINGDWKVIPIHDDIVLDELVTLDRKPEILQSIGPGAKLFSAKYAGLRFDEDVVFCEEHTFIVRAFSKARDIQLIPNIVYGYNEREGSVTAQRADTFLPYMKDALKVRRRVMELLLLIEEKTYYSYRMDNLIVSYLIQAHLMKNSQMTQSFMDSVTTYIKAMQHTHYSGNAMFRIVRAVEQSATNWTKTLYQQWRKTLQGVGIGRPGYLRFKVSVLPRRASFSGKQSLKRMLNKK
ncbi:glycosyltransferase family 2 protein [Staphylococcus capitis]|uniref:glycosyltransferase family 2 protein n=1 Tax=Staphylococcus capitis TaxID=29388 RepID=UPI00345B1A71